MQNHILGRCRMRDEVRQIKPGLYLGTSAFASMFV